jgi:DNA-binding transcriptional regulator YiaG
MHSLVQDSIYPAVITFLGHNAFPEPRTHGEAVQRERRSRGLSMRRFASRAGVDVATLRRVEPNDPRVIGSARLAVQDASRRIEE